MRQLMHLDVRHGSREPLRVLEQGKGRGRLGFVEDHLAAKGTGHGGRETRDSPSHQGRGGESEGSFPTWWPAGGLPVPRPWSLLTVDPNHVLQDEDSLCQDLQGLPQLLHPLALAGRERPGSEPFRFSVPVVPALTSSPLSPSFIQQPASTLCQGWHSNSCSKTRNPGFTRRPVPSSLGLSYSVAA